MSLWDEVRQAFTAHVREDWGDTDALSALNRIAAKVLGLTHVLSINPSNTAVRLELLSEQQLESLKPFRPKSPAPAMNREPIVLLEYGEQIVIVDGNKRVSKWQKEETKRSRKALILTPTQ